jgi:hypothetical protein
MEEAKTFTREYLSQVLAGQGYVTDVGQSLLREVKYAKLFYKIKTTVYIL